MDLKSEYPYCAVKNDLMNVFQQLNIDVTCDVTVVGASLTGALVVDEFIGHDQTTALLQYRSCFADSPSAILSPMTDRVSPCRITSRLLRRKQRKLRRVLNHTQMKFITVTTRSVWLITDNGMSIRARYAVIAIDYEAPCWLRQRASRNHKSYGYTNNFVDPVDLVWLTSTLLWESSLPSLYLRRTSDERLFVRGEDDDRDIPGRRNRLVDRKAAILQRKVSRFPPPLHANPAFAWASTFAKSIGKSWLFGHHPRYGSRVLFAPSYGGNSIPYSMLGAGFLHVQIEHRSHSLTALLSFARPECQ